MRPGCYDPCVDPEIERSLHRYREVLQAHLGDALVTLAAFGSQVQGRARPESDLDVLLIAEGLPRSRLERQGIALGLANAVSDSFAERISVIPLTPEEARPVKPFYLGLLDGYQALVDRGGFLDEILRRLRARLLELGSRRLVDDQGNPYWDLKPDYVLGEDVIL